MTQVRRIDETGTGMALSATLFVLSLSSVDRVYIKSLGAAQLFLAIRDALKEN
jgi:hypothetical protein